MLSKSEKKLKEVYAVSGGSVKYSSVLNTKHIHYELDYNIHNAKGWCPQVAQKGEWIQVGNNDPTMWTSIIIQGRADGNYWVTKLKIAYSLDGHEWKLV